MAPINPFRIAVPDAELNDLRARLVHTRWPEAECVDDWSQGIPLNYTRELADYWANQYDWRAREAALNRFDQYTTEIDGLGCRFNAFTAEEYTAYYVKGAAEYAERAVDVIADMLKNALIPPEEVERERGVVLEEMKMY